MRQKAECAPVSTWESLSWAMPAGWRLLMVPHSSVDGSADGSARPRAANENGAAETSQGTNLPGVGAPGQPCRLESTEAFSREEVPLMQRWVEQAWRRVGFHARMCLSEGCRLFTSETQSSTWRRLCGSPPSSVLDLLTGIFLMEIMWMCFFLFRWKSCGCVFCSGK